MKINTFNRFGVFSGATALLLFFTYVATSAQKVNVELEMLEEQRVNRPLADAIYNYLNIELKVGVPETDAGYFLKVGGITRAEDNLGNSLQAYDEPSYYVYNELSSQHLMFHSIERAATEISILEGTLKYFTPTEANKGLVIVDNPADKWNTNILKGKNADVAVVLLDRPKLQKLKTQNEKGYKQELDKLNKEYGPGAESIQEVNELLENSEADANEVFFFLYQPKGQIVQIWVTNENGEYIASADVAGDSRYLSFQLPEGPLSNTMKIELLIENAQSVKEIPFAFKNIRLP